MSSKSVNQIDNIAPVWDKVAENYEYDSYWSGPENQANFRVLLNHIGDPRGKRIIEVGCGSGFTSVALAGMGAECALLDISQAALDTAVEAFVKCGLSKPQCYLEDALNSSVPSNLFDITWNGGVIEHFYDSGKEVLIKEMLRITKPGGTVIILVPNSWCWQFQLVQWWQKLRKTWPYGFEDDMSPGRLKKISARLGLKNFRVYAFNPVLGWRWLPHINRITKLVGWENVERHCRTSWTGFVSVLVIQK